MSNLRPGPPRGPKSRIGFLLAGKPERRIFSTASTGRAGMALTQSVSQCYTPPSMEDGPTRTHTLHTIGSGADTRHAVTGRSTGSGLLDAQHTAHRTAHEVALYSGVLRDRHGRRRWSTGTGTQDSRTDIPTRAGGGGARERRGVWTRSLAGARPQIRRQSLQAASAIRAGSQKRSGAVLTASSQRTTEFTMMSEEKGCSCGTMR